MTTLPQAHQRVLQQVPNACGKPIIRKKTSKRCIRRNSGTFEAKLSGETPGTLTATSSDQIVKKTGGAVDVVPTGSREFFSLLPPFFMRETTFEEYQPGLYGLTQPLSFGKSFDVRLRMTVAKLGDGSLLVCGPIAPTEEMLSMLWAIEGEVKHIVLPNTSPEHWYFGPALAAKFPQATVWAVPGFWEGKGAPFPPLGLKKMRSTNVCKVLGVDPLPEELVGEVESVVYSTFWFVEAAVVLPRYKALLLADTALMLDPAEYADVGERLEASARKSGIWGQLGPSVTKVAFERKPQEGRQWVEAVLQHDFDTVVVGHASAPVGDGKQAFKQAFSFLY